MAHDILIVDDERDICTLIAGILEDEGHTARRAHDSTEAIDAVRQRRPPRCILDVCRQGSELDGLQLLHLTPRNQPPLPFRITTRPCPTPPPVSPTKPRA